MRVFALETDDQRLINSFVQPTETIVTIIRFSVFQFIFSSLFLGLLTVLFIAAAVAVIFEGLSYEGQLLLALFIGWLILVPYPLFTRYIRWKHSFIVLLKHQIVVILQHSLFHRDISHITLDNFASVSVGSQFAHIFPFGILRFSLKDGGRSAGNDDMSFRYVPQPRKAADLIADTVSEFQREKE